MDHGYDRDDARRMGGWHRCMSPQRCAFSRPSQHCSGAGIPRTGISRKRRYCSGDLCARTGGPAHESVSVPAAPRLVPSLPGEAYLLSGQLDQARASVLQGLEITRNCRFQHGIGWAQRALGRTALMSGALAEAETHFMEALQTFASTQGHFEVGRTHLALAELAHAQGDVHASTTHLHEAHGWFTALQVPKYIERTAQLAREYGVTLAAV